MTTRKLAAIMFTDIVGYTALMGSDEDKAFEVLRKNRQIHTEAIKQFNGQLIKEMGDGILAQFSSAADSVRCAIEIQKQASKELGAKVHIGIHLGDITVENNDVFGDGVNIASRLQSIADPGGIYISESTQKAIRGKSGIQTKYLGEFYLKNVDYLVPTYCLQGDGLPVPSSTKIKKLTKRSITGKVLGSVYTYIILLLLVVIGWWTLKEFFINKVAFSSVIFLPFNNYTGSDTLEYLFAGMHDALIGEAGKISAWQVKSKTTANTYKNVEKSIPEIGTETHSDAAVETTVSCFGEQVCFQVALVDARVDKQLWIKDYVVERAQIPNLLRQLAKEISGEINVMLNPREEKELAETVTVDPMVYDFYMKGQYYLNKLTPGSLDTAMHYFEMAKKREPDYVLAYTGICDVWAYRLIMGLITPAEGNSKSLEAVMKANALDSNNAIVQFTLAHRKSGVLFDWEGAESSYKKAILLNPNHAMSHAFYSSLLSMLGRHDEALEQIDIALRLDPLNPLILTLYGGALGFIGEYNKAIQVLNEVLSMEPENIIPLFTLWRSYYFAGRTEEAYAVMKSLYAMVDSASMRSLEQGYFKDGFRGACRSLADRLGELWTTNHNQIFTMTDIAELYSIGRETDKSIYWLEQAYKFKDPNVSYLLNPNFDFVRNDPRFKELCKIMKIPHAR
jgi:adenylate cyclase